MRKEERGIICVLSSEGEGIVFAEIEVHNPRARDEHGYDCGIGSTFDAEIECEYENRVEEYVEYGSEKESVHGSHWVSRCACDVGVGVAERSEDVSGNDDGEIFFGVGCSLGRASEGIEYRVEEYVAKRADY